MKLTLVALLMMICGAYADTAKINFPVLFEESLTSGRGAGWQESVNDGKLMWNTKGADAGLFATASEGGSAIATLKLKPEVFSGHRVWIHAEYKVSSKVEKSGGRAWMGGIVQAAFVSADGQKGWPNAVPHRLVEEGTAESDWHEVGVIQELPQNLTQFSLMLGIQGAKGTVHIRNLSIMQCDLPAKPEYRPYSGAPQKTQYRGVMSGNFNSMDANDIAVLHEWGANIIRFQIKTDSLKEGNRHDAYFGALKQWLDHLDDVLAECAKYGIKVVIDLHRGPAQTGNGNILTETDEHDALLNEAWAMIAKRYCSHPLVYGYDILNEPTLRYTPYDLARGRKWMKLAEDVVATIRKIDKKTPIIIESEWGGSFYGALFFEPIQDPNIIYSAHFYSPSTFTHQGVNNTPKGAVYPGKVDGKEYNREQLLKDMKPLIDFQKKYNVKVFIGEFSAIAWAPGAAQYLDDAMTLFEELGWDYCYHAFRESECWSLELDGTGWEDLHKPQGDSERLKVIKKYFALNKRK